jgi:hypothetical protein
MKSTFIYVRICWRVVSNHWRYRPDEMVMYVTWRGGKISWLQRQETKESISLLYTSSLQGVSRCERPYVQARISCGLLGCDAVWCFRDNEINFIAVKSSNLTVVWH